MPARNPEDEPYPTDATLEFTPPAVDPANDLTLAAPAEEAAAVSGGVPTIAGYSIEAELGRGGMGVVYRARDLTLGRVVAVKMILSADAAGADNLARFRAEAAAVAELNHQNIVQIYEIGEHDGRPYFTLEFCAKGTLADQVRPGESLPPREATLVIEAIARGIAFAHSRGIVHRDLKPQNVLIADSGEPKVTDFGLAKKVEGGSELTRTGAVLGTPAYMAPEQAGGDGKRVGPAADVYALGAVLFRLLTGRPPFDAESPIDTIMKVVAEEPPPLQSIRPGVPRNLGVIALKCLAKEPDRRYASANELADDLRRWLDGEPITARPVGRVEKLQKWVRRNKSLAGAMLGVALALVTGTAVATWQAARAEREARAAREGQEILRSERERQDGVLYASRLLAAQAEIGVHFDVTARKLLDSCEPDRRGWEWGYLDGLIKGRSRQVLKGHPLPVVAMAMSPDASRIYTAGLDSTVRAWDVPGEAEIGKLENLACQQLALNPAGTLLALTVGKELHIHNAEDLGRLAKVGLDEVVCGVGFIRDGGAERVICLTRNGTLTVRDPRTGEPTRRCSKPLFEETLVKSQPPYLETAFSPDGRLAARGTTGGTFCVWDTRSGDVVWQAQRHVKSVGRIAFSPDGSRVATPGGDGTILVWDAATGRELFALRGHRATAHSVAFSRDGSLIVSGSKDLTVRVWDAETGAPLQVFPGHMSEVADVGVGADRLFASCSYDSSVRVWEMRKSVFVADHVAEIASKTGLGEIGSSDHLTFYGHAGDVRSLDLSKSGRYMATSAVSDPKAEHLVTVWDVDARAEVVHFSGLKAGQTHDVVFRGEGQLLVASSGDGGATGLSRFDTESSSRDWEWVGPVADVASVSLSPDGREAAVLMASRSEGDTNMLAVIDAETGRELSRVTLPEVHASFCFSPSGDEILLGAVLSGKIRSYDPRSGELIDEWQLHGEWDKSRQALTEITVSSQGVLAVAKVDSPSESSILLMDLESRQELRTCRGLVGIIASMSFNPDGSRLISAGGDFSAHLWNVETGLELLRFRDHQDLVMKVRWSGDGDRFATICLDGAARVWSGGNRNYE